MSSMKKRDDRYILEIRSRIAKIRRHLKGVSRASFLKSDLHKSAVIRELEVIGEAARLVSEDTKNISKEIPWKQIMGMRNRLIHEYFSVDDSIIWQVASTDLNKVDARLDDLYLEIAEPIHPWRTCPIGYYSVRKFERTTPVSVKNPDGTSSVRSHCRKNPSGKDQLYTNEIRNMYETNIEAFKTSNTLAIGTISKPSNANDYDIQIMFWTKYWNDIFRPETPLHPNIVKALFFSESSFNLKAKDQLASKGNWARGPMQITDSTRKILSNEKGELDNHYMNMTPNDVKDLNNSLAASIRWLFRKKETASSYLGREATWEEAVAEYKAYLRRKKSWKEAAGIKNFIDAMRELAGL